MGRFMQPCVDCGKLSRNGTRCELHQAQRDRARDVPKAARKRATGQYGGDYRRKAKLIRENAEYCWLCHEGARVDDPFQADHVIPGDPESPLLPAHRSCNAARGNKPVV